MISVLIGEQREETVRTPMKVLRPHHCSDLILTAGEIQSLSPSLKTDIGLLGTGEKAAMQFSSSYSAQDKTNNC